MRTRQIRKTKIQEYNELDDNQINDPENAVDVLPMPYSLIDEILNETILFKLNLKMHEIQQKKKDSNYEGPVKEYLAQNTMDLEGISCLSQPEKSHNFLIAGDKSGTVYLLDLAKKAIFSKKEIVPNKRVNRIVDSIITDGDTSITTAAIIFHNHPSIFIIRYKHSQPKIYLTHEIKVAQDASDPNLHPYSCELHDFARLLTVKTYDGSIYAYKISEVTLDIDKFIKGTPVPLEDEEVRKILRYPLNMSNLQGDTQVIEAKALEIKFPGQRIPPKYKDLKERLLKKKKEPVVEDVGKKDPKKKEEKKPQSQQEIPKNEYDFNNKLEKIEPQIRNGMDESPAYPLPKYEPFIYLCPGSVILPKSRYFEKSKVVPIIQTIIYGWKNTKQFRMGIINEPVLSQIPEYLFLFYHHQRMKEEQLKQLTEYQNQKYDIQKELVFKNVHPITASQISKPDFSLIAFGLNDGTISIWNPRTQNLEYNTEKHLNSVTCLRFFEKWKLISGSSNGEVFIHNVISYKNEVKRTSIFQPKVPISITDIEVNELGIAQVIDSESNMRVFDLWRNEKIAKMNPCTSYAMIENKGKKWLPSLKVGPCQTLYTNRDFSVVISMNWPNFSTRVEDRSEEETQKLRMLTENPWNCSGTSLHVVRNFQIILNLFDGLEATYKKGYERRKIENLFSNLQYAQLLDRNFEIPDFGHPSSMMKKNQSNMNTKSLFSGTRNQKSERSFKSSSKSKQRSKKDASEASKKVRLTNQVLHPEKFLLERRKINKNQMVTHETLINSLRKSHNQKELRENKLISETSKGVF